MEHEAVKIDDDGFCGPTDLPTIFESHHKTAFQDTLAHLEYANPCGTQASHLKNQEKAHHSIRMPIWRGEWYKSDGGLRVLVNLQCI